MGLLDSLLPTSSDTRDTDTIFFTTDIHGSETCFKKLVNAPSFYDVDVLVIGGDWSGKILVPIVDEGDSWTVYDDDGNRTVESEAKLEEITERVRNRGDYPAEMTAAEYERCQEDDDLVDDFYRTARTERLQRWEELADEKLSNVGVYAIAGNDDHQYVIDELREWSSIEFVDGGVATTSTGHEILGYGVSNPTPWDTPREQPDEDIADDLARVSADVTDWSRTIVNVHCPPHNTEIDEAPKLADDLSPEMQGGEVVMEPVSSVAIRKWIENQKPLLGLHGHIHEGQGEFTLGDTMCLNPGSQYSQGTLNGALVTVNDESVVQYQFTSDSAHPIGIARVELDRSSAVAHQLSGLSHISCFTSPLESVRSPHAEPVRC